MPRESSSQATDAAAPDRFPRDPPAPSAPAAYRTLLPTLPTGKQSELSVFLHGDPSARPYGVEDFASALEKIIDLRTIECLGPFQYNHV
ncbi:hypothetical protein HPB48_017649 [Haemaphysalis longicornis]|uniref:Uncharacterized protein n=1 Tax=Haemaphysalis longicornis TaxID=44386 RepID=A0A9J6GWC0_HAELO|nr:hypothetical protein HPB48_017649 [Haemaphysalis longicornis]